MSGNEFVRPTSERLVGSSLNSVFLVYFILACMPVRREEHSRLIFSYICFPGFVILVLLSRYFTDLHNYLNCLKPASKGFAISSRHVCFLQLFLIFRRKEGCEETFISCLLVEYFSVFKKTISRKSKIIENTSSRLKRDLFSRNIFWVFFLIKFSIIKNTSLTWCFCLYLLTLVILNALQTASLLAYLYKLFFLKANIINFISLKNNSVICVKSLSNFLWIKSLSCRYYKQKYETYLIYAFHMSSLQKYRYYIY